MRGVRSDEPRLASGRRRLEVAGHVARRETEGPQATHGQVREILAHPDALLDDLRQGSAHLRGRGIVAEPFMDPGIECCDGLVGGSAGGEGFAAQLGKRAVSAYQRRIQEVVLNLRVRARQREGGSTLLPAPHVQGVSPRRGSRKDLQRTPRRHDELGVLLDDLEPMGGVSEVVVMLEELSTPRLDP